MDSDSVTNSYSLLPLHANAVLLAHDLNVSVFSQLWLVRNEILDEADFGPATMFSHAAVAVQARTFHLTILPDRLQLLPNDIGNGAVVNEVFGKILKLLPHTPFRALGFNFNFAFGPKDPAEFQQWNRQSFKPNVLNALPLDDGSNPLFGAYFSYDESGFRAKIDLKPCPSSQFPALLQTGYPKDSQVMIASFNFHRDLGNDDPALIALELLPNWNQVFESALVITTQLSSK